MVISSPGGFIGGITPDNILHHEPKARNRLLAEMFQKIGLVERAGMGRRRIFIPTLAYGKRLPRYEADANTVVLPEKSVKTASSLPPGKRIRL